MIDFHTHILPALDDGAVTVDDSIAMAREMVSFGYKTVCCTPHCIRGYYDLTPQKVRESTLMLQADLDNANIHLELWPGMEYMLDEFFSEYVEDLLPLGPTRLILCEAPPKAHPGVVREGLDLILEKGFVPLVAHPERTRIFYELLQSRSPTSSPEGEEDFQDNRPFEPKPVGKKAGGFFKSLWPFSSGKKKSAAKTVAVAENMLPEFCLFQANLGSFTGYYGETVQRRAYEFLKQGVYTALASDLHDFGAAEKVLIRDKVDTNPLLQKVAAFNGATSSLPRFRVGAGSGGQGELFA